MEKSAMVEGFAPQGRGERRETKDYLPIRYKAMQENACHCWATERPCM
jgi:hypothetical protein